MSTTSGLIAELVASPGLTRGPDGRYEIGCRIWDLGGLAAVSRERREWALPFMQDLSSTTGEKVHIAVLEGTAALHIDRIAGRRAIQVVCLQNLTRITPHTVVEPKRLIRQLAEAPQPRVRDHVGGDDNRRLFDRSTDPRRRWARHRRAGSGDQ